MKVRLIDKTGRIIFSTIEDHEVRYFDGLNKESLIIEDGGRKFRVGLKSNTNGTVWGVSYSKDCVKSSRVFISILENSLESLGYIINKVSEIESKINTDTKRLLHNLTSLNAHNIQEIYSLVPQENIVNNVRQHIDYVEKIVSENPRACALTLIRIAKNNAAIKTEFSVFKRFSDADTPLFKRNHSVHKVLMNMLYIFFSDFTDKNVYVDIQSSSLMAYFEYETIHVALYYIIENAVKYICPNSTLNIRISDNDEYVIIVYDMHSIQIKKEEECYIFNEGYIGSIPYKLRKSGAGIGMYRSLKLLLLNNGNLRLKTYPETLFSNNGIPYQRNNFIVYLKKG